MTEYLITNGITGRLAGVGDGPKLQRIDIANTIKLNDLIANSGHTPDITPERLRHLGVLLAAIDEIPENELPKTVNIPN